MLKLTLRCVGSKSVEVIEKHLTVYYGYQPVRNEQQIAEYRRALEMERREWYRYERDQPHTHFFSNVQ